MFRGSRLQQRTSTSHRGFTLVELLISMAVSLIAVAGMVLVMGNVLGTTSDTIKATRLSGELRTAMQVLTRDLRRANFNETFAGCIGIGSNVCTNVPDTFVINNTDGSECLAYSYRRLISGTWTDQFGAVRLNNGVMEYKTNNAGCGNGTWVPITDGDIVQVTGFDLVETDGDQLLTHVEPNVNGTLSQRVRKLRITMTGQICANGPLTGCSNWNTRQVQNTIRVRNDLLFAPSP